MVKSDIQIQEKHFSKAYSNMYKFQYNCKHTHEYRQKYGNKYKYNGTAVWTRIEMCRDFFVKASLTFF